MAVQASQPKEIINRMAVHRDSYYRSLSTFDKFGRGWIRRNDETREQAIDIMIHAPDHIKRSVSSTET
jgi:lysozyme family protein